MIISSFYAVRGAEVYNFLGGPRLFAGFACATSPYLSTFGSRPAVSYFCIVFAVGAVHMFRV